MILTRAVGKLLRGKATPLQILMACLLGGILGFIPGPMQAPGLMVVLFVLLAVLNANLIAASLVAAFGQLFSLFLTPLTFAVGQATLDGPLQPMFKKLINAPGTALLGLEYYVTTGGIVMGLIYGLICGLVMISIVQRFRRKMATVSETSEFYKKMTRNPISRFIIWIVFGGKSKRSYDQLAHRKFGLPIRPLGVVLVGLVCALVYVLRGFVNDQIITPMLTWHTRETIERVNGATVDIQQVRLDFDVGKVTMDKLAVADRNDLNEDVFRAEKLEGNFSGYDLWRKRLTIDELLVSGAVSGAKRPSPGVLIGRRPPPPTPPGEGKTIEDYLKEAEKWKKRLEQIERWIDEIGKRDPTRPDKTPEDETYRERVEREIREKGYRRVTASHLVDVVPTLTIKRIVIEDMPVEALPGDPLDITVLSISTQPWLLDDPPQIERMESQSGKFSFALQLGSVSKARTQDLVWFQRTGLSAVWIQDQIFDIDDKSPVKGGTFDLALGRPPAAWAQAQGEDVQRGSLRLGRGVLLDLDLRVTMHDTLLTIPKLGATNIDELVLPIHLTGRLSAPRIKVDPRQLSDALLDAGKAELADRLRDEAGKLLDGKLGDQLGPAGDQLIERGLEGILGPGRKKKKDDAKKDDEDR